MRRLPAATRNRGLQKETASGLQTFPFNTSIPVLGVQFVTTDCKFAPMLAMECTMCVCSLRDETKHEK